MLKLLAPDLAHVACFDTACHATDRMVACRHALPVLPETKGMLRTRAPVMSTATP
ncbi:MAG: hypothetical protein AAF577_07810 [Pseudomonadota bacterium]